MKALSDVLPPIPPGDLEPRDPDDAWACGCPFYRTVYDARGKQYVGWHQCCTCGDAGFVRRDHPVGHSDFGKAWPCPECSVPKNPATAREQFVRAARIPKLYANLRLPDFRAPPDQAAKDAASNYASAWPPELPFLTFTSPTKGNGKTMLACGILQSAFERHQVRGRFFSVVRLLEEYRQGYAREKAGEQRIIAALDDKLQLSPLLVLDDLAAERATDWTRDRLYQVIGLRYAQMMPTVVTTNIDFDARDFDDRIASRLHDPRAGRVVLLTGPDHRMESRRA